MQVSGEAQGSKDSIQSFLKEINSGPSAAHVVKVEKEEIKVKVRSLQSNVRLFGRGMNDFLFFSTLRFPSKLGSYFNQTILTAKYD